MNHTQYCNLHVPMRWMPTTVSSGPEVMSLYLLMGFSPTLPSKYGPYQRFTKPLLYTCACNEGVL